MTTRGDNIEASAGCVIFREDAQLGTCVLLLQTYSKFDLPKGHIEKKDASVFKAASRETYEECGFNVLEDPNALLSSNLPIAKILHGTKEPIECLNISPKNGMIKKIVYLFPAFTLCSKVVLLPNQKSGILEHQSYKWHPAGDIATSGLHSYLQAGVVEAFELYKVHSLVDKALEQFRDNQ